MTACWAVEETAAIAAASLVATVTSKPADCSTRFLLCKLSVPPTQSTAAISPPGRAEWLCRRSERKLFNSAMAQPDGTVAPWQRRAESGVRPDGRIGQPKKLLAFPAQPCCE
jgi:hypothetical protein